VLANSKGLFVMRKFVVGVASALAVLTAGCAAAPVAPPAPAPAPTVSLTTEKAITLPGTGGHGDVVVADPSAHAVYIAQSPDNNVVVIDTTTNAVKAVIPHIPSANGITFTDPYVFVAEAPANAVAVIAKATWQVVATVPSGGKTPDALYYDSKDNRVFVANDDSNNMQEFTATAPFTIQGTLALQPSPAKTGPDLGTYSPAEDRIYQADDNDVVVIDAKNRVIQKVIQLQLPNGAAAKDMYYEQAHHLLWIATSGPEVLAVDTDTGATVATVKTASGADQVAADPQRGLLFIGEGKAGAMGVIDLATRHALANLTTEPDFHTQDSLPGTDLVYAYLNTSNVIDVDRIAIR
jgi:YVTN family beta-propeller protein